MTGYGAFLLALVLLAGVRAAAWRMGRNIEPPRPGLPRYPANDK